MLRLYVSEEPAYRCTCERHGDVIVLTSTGALRGPRAIDTYAHTIEAALEEQLAALLQAAPIAARQLKETLRIPILRDLDQALAREAACQAVDFSTRDLKEAVRAFAAGEKPEFTGE